MLRLGLMAWMLIFVCGQIQASSHLHIDSHADEPCVVCIQGQDQPTATNNTVTALTCNVTYPLSLIRQTSCLPSSIASPYLSRAPPQS